MRIILADSNDLMRVGMRTILSAKDNLEIVGEARNKEELKQQIKSFTVDVVLIDYTSNGFDIDIIPSLLASNSDLRFIAITP